MKHNKSNLPPEFYYDQEEKKKQKQLSRSSYSFSNRIIKDDYVVPISSKGDFRKKINLRSKSYVRKSIECELCDQLCSEGYQYADKEGWIYYLCKSCARQVGGPCARKIVISTPMGGLNKRY